MTGTGVHGSASRVWPGRPDPAAMAVAVAVVIAATALGLLAVVNLTFALAGLGLVIAMLLVAVRPVLIAVAAVGCIIIPQRLAGGAISYSDAVLAAAAVLSLLPLIGSLERGRLTRAMQALGLYLTLLLPSVLINHSMRANLEWLHRLVLVGGAIAVGAWLVRERRVVPAMRGLLVLATALALLAVKTSIQTGFQPAYPLGFHKNFIGAMFGPLVVCLVAAPELFRLRPLVRWPALVIMSLGLLASQSRGAMLAVALGILIYALRRTPANGGTAKNHTWAMRLFAIALAGVIGYLAFTLISNQLADKESENTNSIGVRYRVEARTREVWHTSPVVGVGLKYFNTGLWGPDAQASNNAINNELAESGVIGAAGWIGLHASLVVLLLRRRTVLATAALAVLSGRILHGQLDIYWSAGVASLTMLLVGIALASSDEPARASAVHPSHDVSRVL